MVKLLQRRLLVQPCMQKFPDLRKHIIATARNTYYTSYTKPMMPVYFLRPVCSQKNQTFHVNSTQRLETLNK